MLAGGNCAWSSCRSLPIGNMTMSIIPVKSKPPFENGFSYPLASEFDSNAELQLISSAKSHRMALVG